jgi:hypothetical protein
MAIDRDLSPLMSTSQAATYLGVAPGTLRVWRHLGRHDQPAYVKVGRRVRYAPGELARWVTTRTEQPGTNTQTKNCGPQRQQRRRGPQ